MQKYLESPVFQQKPGPLALFIQEYLKIAHTERFRYVGGAEVVTSVATYRGDAVELGPKRWKLRSNDDLVIIHLKHIPKAANASLDELGALRANALEALKLSIRDELFWPDKPKYIIATSNNRLIKVLMRAIPGFAIGDHIDPDSIAAKKL